MFITPSPYLVCAGAAYLYTLRGVLGMFRTDMSSTPCRRTRLRQCSKHGHQGPEHADYGLGDDVTQVPQTEEEWKRLLFGSSFSPISRLNSFAARMAN